MKLSNICFKINIIKQKLHLNAMLNLNVSIGFGVFVWVTFVSLMWYRNFNYSYFSSSFFSASYVVFKFSRRWVNSSKWNFTGLLPNMSRSAVPWKKFQNGRHYKMAAIATPKLKKFIKNPFLLQSLWNLVGIYRLMSHTIWQPFWIVMAAILNPRWPPKCENAPIYMKFCILVAYDAANHYLKSVY